MFALIGGRRSPALFFFFQAEDGIRAGHVTGVQTCALPISTRCSRERFCACRELPLSSEAAALGLGEIVARQRLAVRRDVAGGGSRGGSPAAAIELLDLELARIDALEATDVE